MDTRNEMGCDVTGLPNGEVSWGVGVGMEVRDWAFGARTGYRIWHLLPGMGLLDHKKGFFGQGAGKTDEWWWVRTALPQLCRFASSSPSPRPQMSPPL